MPVNTFLTLQSMLEIATPPLNKWKDSFKCTMIRTISHKEEKKVGVWAPGSICASICMATASSLCA